MTLELAVNLSIPEDKKQRIEVALTSVMPFASMSFYEQCAAIPDAEKKQKLLSVARILPHLTGKQLEALADLAEDDKRRKIALSFLK